MVHIFRVDNSVQFIVRVVSTKYTLPVSTYIVQITMFVLRGAYDKNQIFFFSNVVG